MEPSPPPPSPARFLQVTGLSLTIDLAPVVGSTRAFVSSAAAVMEEKQELVARRSSRLTARVTSQAHAAGEALSKLAAEGLALAAEHKVP